jgi:hypothetical protein
VQWQSVDVFLLRYFDHFSLNFLLDHLVANFCLGHQFVALKLGVRWLFLSFELCLEALSSSRVVLRSSLIASVSSMVNVTVKNIAKFIVLFPFFFFQLLKEVLR